MTELRKNLLPLLIVVPLACPVVLGLSYMVKLGERPFVDFVKLLSDKIVETPYAFPTCVGVLVLAIIGFSCLALYNPPDHK